MRPPRICLLEGLRWCMQGTMMGHARTVGRPPKNKITRFGETEKLKAHCHLVME